MQSSVFFNLEAKHSPYGENPEEKSLASDLLHLCNDSLESLRVVNSEVSENLTVDLGALHKAGIEINRKVLADLAVNNPEAFKAIVAKVK